MKQRGFTVIELLVVLAFVATAAVLFLSQKGSLEATHRDETRKTAINAMHYNLEEVYFVKNGYYPESIDAKTLRAMDPTLFRDPNGAKLGEPQSDYRYEPTDCTLDKKCQHYTLSATLEREARYSKESRN